MPLKKDPKGGGTERDGSLSNRYCSYCYEAGEFKQPDITVKEMQHFVVEKLKEMGFPRFIGRFMVKDIPKLERWKTTIHH